MQNAENIPGYSLPLSIHEQRVQFILFELKDSCQVTKKKRGPIDEAKTKQGDCIEKTCGNDIAGSLEALTEGEAAYLARFSSLESFAGQADERLREAGRGVLLQKAPSSGLIAEETPISKIPKRFSASRKMASRYSSPSIFQHTQMSSQPDTPNLLDYFKIRMQTAPDP